MINFKQLFAVLLISSLSFSALSFGELPYTVSEHKIDLNSVKENVNQIADTQLHHTLKLFENIDVKLNDDKTNESLPKKYQTENQKTLSLHEFINVISNDSAKNSFLLIKHNSEQKAIMERIFQQDKKRKHFDSKFINFEILYPDLFLTKFEKLFSDNYFEIDETIFDFILLDQLLSQDILQTILTNNISSSFDKFVQSFSDDLVKQKWLDVKQPSLLFLLLPIAGFIIVRSENEKVSFSDVKPILSFCFILILIFSVVSVPLSISSIYWGVAFAQEAEPELTDQKISNKQKS